MFILNTLVSTNSNSKNSVISIELMIHPGFGIEIYEKDKKKESINSDKILYYLNSLETKDVNLELNDMITAWDKWDILEDRMFEYNEINKAYRDQYNEIVRLQKTTIINEKTNEITIKIDDKEEHDLKIKFELITKTLDWNFIKDQLKVCIEKKFNISDFFFHI